MEALAIPAAVGAVLLLCLFAGWALVRRWRPPASTAPSVRAPEQWRALLEDRVPLVRRLAPGEWDRLFELVQTFLREKHFEGGGGLEVTDEMKIIVAAQACLLILHLDAGCYPGVRTIILYPSTFLRRSPAIDGRMYVGVIPHPEPLLGEHVRGAVVLAWDSSLHGASETGDGQNVVLHEFAHQLDHEDGVTNGAPLLDDDEAAQEWGRVMTGAYEQLWRDVEHNRHTLIDEYGASDPAEFFAVVTECFFERPHAMQRHHPELYGVLKQFYRQDPAALLARTK